MLAMTHGLDWIGHVPGPRGLPGGYPVRLKADQIDLDLPASLTRSEAIAWNLRYEQECGLVVGPDGRAAYTGRLHERIASFSPDLAAGFHVRDIHEVYRAMHTLRTRLEGQPA